MFQFSKSDKNLVGFVSLGSDHQMCKNAVVLVPGVTDGFMSMAYSSTLAKSLQAKGFSLVQAQISSSFMQFGFSSIEKDCEELTVLISYLRDEMAFQKIVFLGHSTGAQDAVYFMQHSPMRGAVSAVILQGAVGDRDIINSDPSLRVMIEEAKKLRQEGKEQAFLSGTLYEAPVTAARFLSLSERLSKEDMFSLDLTEEELANILKPVQVPILLSFSSNDEYVPDYTAQKALAERMVKVLKAQKVPVECNYYEGDHGLTEESMYSPFVADVIQFIS